MIGNDKSTSRPDKFAIQINGLGKMYRLYSNPFAKLIDAFNLSNVFFWKKNSYKEFWALRDLDLQVLRGERLGIIGRNGAGKSTLLKVIIGNITPSEGKVFVNGDIQALMELGTGFHPEFTGRENIHASLAYLGHTAESIRSLEEQIIDFAEVGQFIDQPIKTYSAGMYARLAFATATSVKPNILIIDEVLGAGDAYFAGKCADRMQKLTEDAGATVLFVSHDLGSVQQMCDRVIWIDRGKIVHSGDPLHVTKAYYASVLNEEKIRLQTRNFKQAEKQINGQDNTVSQPEVHQVFFRLTIDNGNGPYKKHPIRRLSLSDQKDIVFSVEVGAPMDNDITQAAYLIYDEQLMNWSAPTKVKKIRVRYVESSDEQYKHAPFIFSVPRTLWQSSKFLLEIEHAVQDGEDVWVEMLEDGEYKRLGKLTPAIHGWYVDTYPATLANKEAFVLNTKLIKYDSTKDKWQDNDVYIEFAKLVDVNYKSNSVFSLGDTINLDILIRSKVRIQECWLAIPIYDERGNCVFQKVKKMINGIPKGKIRYIFSIIQPQLRQGNYVFSIGLLSEYNPNSTSQLSFYCLWNRCIEFRIDEGYIGNIPLGIVDFSCKLISKNLKK